MVTVGNSISIDLALLNDDRSGGLTPSTLTPVQRLTGVLRAQLLNAVDAIRSGLLTYESLRNISEVIGGEYGDRVIFELLQNAHDAHDEGEDGSILLKLMIHGPERGDLFVANRGKGFTWENVNAIRNVGVSSKSVGEGIGNKGLGFRSVETLTDDPRIYSQTEARSAEAFDGYCFRFAGPDEVLQETLAIAEREIAERVSTVLPRYLAAVPLMSQPEEIREFARLGFATVVHLPLRSANAVLVAREQVGNLAKTEAPLLLFLDRLARVTVEVNDIELEDIDAVKPKTLTRTVLSRPQLDPGSSLRYEIVSVGPGNRRFLVARREVDRRRLSEAVEASISKEPQLSRWRDWQGEPTVAVAVPLSTSEVERGRTYNFLPMASEVPSPIRGHVDAPFYASIDRRRANFDLPLNSILLDEIAETAMRAAIELKPMADEIGSSAIFDLAAWSPDDVLRLLRTSKRIGTDWRDCQTVPAAGDNGEWVTFRNARIWPEQGYKLLRVRRLVKAGVRNLADPGLGLQRLERLGKLMEATNIRSMPDERGLAEWIESVARSLDQDGSPARTWGTLYDEARKALTSMNGLRQLAGKLIMKTRDGGLHAAMGLPSGAPVFVRERSSSSRDRDRAPLPPSTVASKFAILADDIPVSPEVVSDFIKAGLLRRYDALQVLQSVPSLFGDKPAPKRREAALKWAFDVWRAEGPRSERVLREIDLHVETRSGWREASTARFSEGWTPEGRKLSTYLAEAASLSPDCVQAARFLLVSEPDWAPKSESGRRLWTDFLRKAGVRNGLPLLDDEDAPRSGTPSYVWDAFRRRETPAKGRSRDWIAANSRINLLNPLTNYSRKGELWRFPGQIEHADLPSEARHRLAELILVQLADEDQTWLRWHLGRYERWGSDQNERELLTPAAVFIAAEPWLPVEGEAERFERPRDLWSSRDRKQKPPRYVDRPRERLADMIEEEKHLTTAMFRHPVSLRDWPNPDEAVRKLADLARGSAGLAPRERVNFRRVYQRAWAEACVGDLPLPADLSVVVATSLGLAVLTGKVAEPPRIFLTGDPLQSETKAITAAGQAVLELGEEELVSPTMQKLRASGGFDTMSIDRKQVEVFLDDEVLVPSLANPLLANDGLEWLPEAAVLANEVLGRELERQISSSTIDQRLRRVRVRQCGRITLAVAGAAVDEVLPFYALPDDELPTLVIGDNQDITWAVLADAAPHLSMLLDRRMRSFETLLLRLAARGVSFDPRQRPSDEDFARALGCKVELVREHALALRADGDLLIRRLLPVVACVTDLETAKTLGIQLGDSALRSQVLEALVTIEDRLPVGPAELLDELARADFAEVRRTLGLNYSRLNQMLTALGQPILSNEGELRRLFEIWKGELLGPAIERVRRRYWPDFRSGSTLDDYVRLRSLDFLEFQSEWIMEKETLEREEVSSLLDRMLDALIGKDVELELEPVNLVRNRSKRTLQKFIEDAASTIEAWCFRNGRSNPWGDGTLAVLKSVDQHGLLDFASIERGHEIATIVRAGCWPADMPHVADPAALGLDPDDLLGAKKREQERLEQAEVSRRTVRFAGSPLDTRSKDFAQTLIALADAQMKDNAWLTRSRRRFNLAEQASPDRRNGGPGGKSGKRRRHERVSEDVKSAMGFASEYLASHFLRQKHKDHYNDRCWVSENRSRFEIDWEGDDRLGFDFKVQTIEVEWRYEVKSNFDEAFEFEFTQNEMRSAAECASEGSKKYRILYVPYVFDPSRWRVMELPNPMSDRGRRLFRAVGTGSTRFKFEPS
ncbi:sacsin N-terminal ATP-binding-like domain-containing protein [Ensifer sp. ENS03]|uniref:sacsin N-terminal ATP-binding-like domain-containing protein n=1 Tax=Ensifer sp. ENS03 TaxID=2769283 RepID=UPI00177CDAB1|nr:DUF3883 domain-containing protein [Ensifer sp. ENS03]MBD9561081.1 DUF3883 domain-containing protein [Ensifer sp. ENS03]